MSGLPSRIGKYTVHERLGRGGMAEVYLAYDAKLDRLVALKLLREFDHDELLKRFEREARAIARLTHPNIVTIYELGDHDGRPFIAMEYVAGESLAEITRRRAILPLSSRLKLIEDLCAGLACAHRAGIVHRDVKPANLMVDNQSVLKVLDFGIVRMAGPGLTQMGTLVGTVNYMSPEQVSADSVDHRSDIFSVGAVFYELLAYRQAFTGTFVEVIAKIVHAEPTPLSALCTDLDPELVAMVSRCLAKPPGARYQDLLALRADVERARQRLEGKERYAALDARHEETLIVPTPTPSSPRAPDAPPADAEDAAREVDTWLRRAGEHLDAGHLAMAADLIGRAGLRAPNLPQLLALRRELERAVIDQERTEQRKRAVRASLQRAQVKLEDGAHESASRAIAEALALDPQSAEALDLRARIEAAKASARRRAEALQAAEEAVRHARELFTNGDTAAALASLEAHSPPHTVVTHALQELRAEVAAGERRHEEQELQRREDERRDREQRVSAALAAAREAIAAERFEEAVALLDRAPAEEAHAAAVEALRQAGRTGAERLRAAHDAVARAKGLASRGAFAIALHVLDHEAPDHPAVSRERGEVRRMLRRQEWQQRWGALRARTTAGARSVDHHVREGIVPAGVRAVQAAGTYTASRTRTVAAGSQALARRTRAGALQFAGATRLHTARALQVARHGGTSVASAARHGTNRAIAAVRTAGQQATLHARTLLHDRRRLAVMGGLLILATLSAILITQWPRAARTIAPMIARSPADSSSAATSRGGPREAPGASSPAAPSPGAAVVDTPDTGRDPTRPPFDRDAESSTEPPPTDAAREASPARPGSARAREGGGESPPDASSRRDARTEEPSTPSEKASGDAAGAATPETAEERPASPEGAERPDKAAKSAPDETRAASAQITARAAILRLLNDYESAYSSLDEPKVRQLQPSFKGFPPTYRTLLRSLTLTILSPSINISSDGETATVQGILRHDYVWRRAGLQPTSSVNVSWRLKKVGTAWVIGD